MSINKSQWTCALLGKKSLNEVLLMMQLCNYLETIAATMPESLLHKLAAELSIINMLVPVLQ